ncbi:MAG: transcription antitermination factor NusB [Candidatus Mycalebacterium zealandia]|nr:MAG: transcription antitermination factor NusB [Candidatus Mycalebacterium zealandia]
MKKRRLSREFAFQFLYQRDANGLLHEEVSREITEKDFERFVEASEEKNPSDKKFAVDIASGICEKINEIDSRIENCSDNWKISRMSAVDINIMRVAVYELLYMRDIDKAVSINEAIEIATKYGTEESGTFINGILDKIQTEATTSNA